MDKKKIVVGVLGAVALVAALFLINRFWIAPATQNPGGMTDHPEAPDFETTAIDGSMIRLADYKGKVVLLNFWATWCGPCRVEIPDFIELVNQYGDDGFAILGISIDEGPEEDVREFYDEFKMNYPVGINPLLADLYGGMIGIPTSFLIGRDGRIYSRHIGLVPSSKIEEEIRTLLAQQNGQEVDDFQPVGGESGEPIELGNPDAIFSEVPGIDLSELSEEEKEAFKAALAEEMCTCGCGLNLLKCRVDDSSCGVSLGLVKERLAALQGRENTEPGEGNPDATDP